MIDVTIERPGARVEPDGTVRFRVWAPNAKEVKVRLLDASAQEESLTRGADGYFAGKHARARTGSDYLLRVDGGPGLPDPASRWQPMGIRGPSRVWGPYTGWTDHDWKGIERPDLVIYELHVGTFSRAGSFDGVVQALPALRELGVNALEIMPIAEFPGTRNWGYDGVFPFAAQSSYGGPDGFAALVDAAHAHEMAVLLDVVYNHLGPEGNVLPEFGPYFATHATPWGNSLNFDGPQSDAVCDYFISNACSWIEEFHLDGLRLDAVHAIFDRNAVPMVEHVCTQVHALGKRLKRRVHVILETDENNPRYVRSRERGGYDADAIWNDDFHHAVHCALTGESQGYYVDFAEPDALSRVWLHRFALDGVYSRHRSRRHGAPADDVARDRFVVCIQNHDQVGNRALGERLVSLVSPEHARVAAALLLLSPYIPLLFMGEEYGETQPFLYFVSHQDAELRRAVQEGRKEEFAAFGFSNPPDPCAETTFHESMLRRDRAKRGAHAKRLALYTELLSLRRSEPSLRPGDAEIALEVGETGTWLVSHAEVAGSRSSLSIFMWGEGSSDVPVSFPGNWERVLDTEEARFGGGGPHLPQELHVAPKQTTRVRVAGPVGGLFVERAR